MADRPISRPVLIVPDPHCEYGEPVIGEAIERHGLGVVCLHTDPTERARDAAVHKVRRGGVIEHHWLGAGGVRAVVEEVRTRHFVAGFAPLLERHVAMAAEAAEAGVGSVDAAVWRRSRDKRAIRHRLDLADVPMPRWLDPSDEELLLAAVNVDWERIVAKPVAGHGSTDVGFFRSDAAGLAELHAHVEHRSGWILEEFVPGPVLSLNGMVDHEGEVHLLAVFENRRLRANRHEELYGDQWSVPVGDVRLPRLAALARRTARALELRSTPFHFEVKEGPDGPLLIDIGARLPGNHLAFVMDRLHEGRLDMVRLAVAGWLGIECAPAVGWEDISPDVQTLRVYGIAHDEGRVRSMAGAQRVARLDGFAGWARKPVRGELVRPTTDLASIPWAADFVLGPTSEPIRSISAVVREAMLPEDDASSATWAVSMGAAATRKLTREARARRFRSSAG